MQKITYTIRIILLMLCVLCTTGNMQAAIRTVTNAKADNSEGSLLSIFQNLEDDDVIEFADELKDQTIEFGTNEFGPLNANTFSLTMIGNGVTISGGYPMFVTASLRMENMRFKDSSISFFTTKSAHIKNCIFFTTKEADNALSEMYMGVFVENGASIFENCAFMAKDANRRSVSLSVQDNTSFISCTFYKKSYTPAKKFSDQSLITITNTNITAQLTNCVIMDSNTSKATFSNTSKVLSRGYNVILPGSQSPITALTPVSGSVQSDVILEQESPLPLTWDEDIWKVPTTSPAYRHLPMQSVLKTDDLLNDVAFPATDLAGNGIDYTC
ncbi:MAG: hypothetical protein LBD89_01200, partial [Tannerellaceae bacterium]|nr:hypothetical protein [Tannerellaceae bacterium]